MQGGVDIYLKKRPCGEKRTGRVRGVLAILKNRWSCFYFAFNGTDSERHRQTQRGHFYAQKIQKNEEIEP